MIKQVNRWVWMLAVSASTLFLGGCDRSDNAVEPDEGELITTVTMRFTEQGVTNPQSQTVTVRDLDGDGGQPPVTTGSISLRAGRTYTLNVAQVLDESKSPAENVLEEIEEEADEHLFVYTPSPASLLTYTYGDRDRNNRPIGITGTVVAGTAGTGTLNVRLRHQPGTKDGTPTPGSDDVNITFPVTVAN